MNQFEEMFKSMGMQMDDPANNGSSGSGGNPAPKWWIKCDVWLLIKVSH